MLSYFFPQIHRPRAVCGCCMERLLKSQKNVTSDLLLLLSGGLGVAVTLLSCRTHREPPVSPALCLSHYFIWSRQTASSPKSSSMCAI